MGEQCNPVASGVRIRIQFMLTCSNRGSCGSRNGRRTGEPPEPQSGRKVNRTRSVRLRGPVQNRQRELGNHGQGDLQRLTSEGKPGMPGHRINWRLGGERRRR